MPVAPHIMSKDKAKPKRAMPIWVAERGGAEVADISDMEFILSESSLGPAGPRFRWHLD